MKRPKDADELAARLTAGATTPLQILGSAVAQDAASSPKKGRGGKQETVSVFLRLAADLHSQIDAIAVERTKETGRGVSVQQIIIEILERSF